MHGLERKIGDCLERIVNYPSNMVPCKLGRRADPSVRWASGILELFRFIRKSLLFILLRKENKKESPQPAKTKNTNRMKATEI